MKKLLLILFLFTSYTSFSQGKIGGEGNVIPTGNYPIVASKDIKGTLHTFKTIVQRDALPANYKDTGMLAYVVDSLKYYKWNGADWEEFKTGSDAPTDYFNSYTQASDSSYLQTNRKDGTKQYVVIQADGLTGGNSSGGVTTSQLSDSLNSFTWERSLQNQGSTPFSTDNTVDFGGHSFVLYGISPNDGITFNSTKTHYYQDSSGFYLQYNNGGDGNSAIEITNQSIFLGGGLSNPIILGQNGLDANPIIIRGLDSSNANLNNIAWFDENNILHRGSINIDSTVTLSSGTITVSDSRVHTGAKIFVSVNTPSGTQGFLSAKTSDIVDGTSFIINSTSATDNSTVNYEIINP